MRVNKNLCFQSFVTRRESYVIRRHHRFDAKFTIIKAKSVSITTLFIIYNIAANAYQSLITF